MSQELSGLPDFSQFKICFLAGTLGQGGAERQLFLTCSLLKERGAKVHVLSLTKGEFWEQKLLNAGVPVTWVGASNSKVMRILAIRKQLKLLKPLFCQSQHFFANLYAALACKGLPIKSIGAVRSNLHLEMASRNPRLCRWSLTWPDIIFANSVHAIQNAPIYRISKERFRFFPNILKVADFPMVKPTLKSQYRILGVGRLVDLKHWHVFLEVIAELRRLGYAVEGTLVGDGPMRESLTKQAKDLGLLPNGLIFAGAVPDVRPYYATADLLLATSFLEGTPNAIMEAMACGLPVVTTNVGDIPNLIQSGIHGFLNEVDDQAGLSKHCIKLLTHFDVRRTMGHAARNFIQDTYSPETVCQRVHSLYKDLLS